MLHATCHCGAFQVGIPQAPEKITNCNCSICRRYGALWGYFDSSEVELRFEPGTTREYSWGRRSLVFVGCGHCGCVMCWRPLAGRVSPRMGVNIRNFDPELIGPVTIQLLDGAVTEEYVGEQMVGLGIG